MEMDVSNYINLIAAFVCGDLSALEFERDYLRMFKEDTRMFPDELYEILNKLFTDVDAFCGDPACSRSNNLNEVQLRECAQVAYEALTNM
jgi:hypothetical protein